MRARRFHVVAKLLLGDSAELRKARGAFFTPPVIAAHLAQWAIGGNPNARVLDPTCGEAVFLKAAGQVLRDLGRLTSDLDALVYGVDLHSASLDEASRFLEEDGLDAHLIASDFFAVGTPGLPGSPLPLMDAVIGNPPFVRYQEHVGESRRMSVAAALRQGVRLNGLASSWAASLVHSAGFLKPEGRLAMVIPEELLTVGYAEPVRTWLQRRFEAVNLIMFERLQFEDAQEKVVLLLAEGSGGCESFSLYRVDSAEDLDSTGPYSHRNIVPPNAGKWTDALLTRKQLRLFRDVESEHFTSLRTYGTSELGIVTGANDFFTLSETTRRAYGLNETQLAKISPPGTKHFRGLTFSAQQWEKLKLADERVWLFRPEAEDASKERRKYTDTGESQKVNEAYKCSIRAVCRAT